MVRDSMMARKIFSLARFSAIEKISALSSALNPLTFNFGVIFWLNEFILIRQGKFPPLDHECYLSNDEWLFWNWEMHRNPLLFLGLSPLPFGCFPNPLQY